MYFNIVKTQFTGGAENRKVPQGENFSVRYCEWFNSFHVNDM